MGDGVRVVGCAQAVGSWTLSLEELEQPAGLARPRPETVGRLAGPAPRALCCFRVDAAATPSGLPWGLLACSLVPSGSGSAGDLLSPALHTALGLGARVGMRGLGAWDAEPGHRSKALLGPPCVRGGCSKHVMEMTF